MIYLPFFYIELAVEVFDNFLFDTSSLWHYVEKSFVNDSTLKCTVLNFNLIMRH